MRKIYVRAAILLLALSVLFCTACGNKAEDGGVLDSRTITAGQAAALAAGMAEKTGITDRVRRELYKEILGRHLI